ASTSCNIDERLAPVSAAIVRHCFTASSSPIRTPATVATRATSRARQSATKDAGGSARSSAFVRRMSAVSGFTAAFVTTLRHTAGQGSSTTVTSIPPARSSSASVSSFARGAARGCDPLSRARPAHRAPALRRGRSPPCPGSLRALRSLLLCQAPLQREQLALLHREAVLVGRERALTNLAIEISERVRDG